MEGGMLDNLDHIVLQGVLAWAKGRLKAKPRGRGVELPPAVGVQNGRPRYTAPRVPAAKAVQAADERPHDKQ